MINMRFFVLFEYPTRYPHLKFHINMQTQPYTKFHTNVSENIMSTRRVALIKVLCYAPYLFIYM